jgi:hypothetical protein
VIARPGLDSELIAEVLADGVPSDRGEGFAVLPVGDQPLTYQRHRFGEAVTARQFVISRIGGVSGSARRCEKRNLRPSGDGS